MAFDDNLSTKEYIHYKISTKSKINNHDKYALISVKIKNPWFGKAEKKLEELDIKEEYSNIEANIENTEEEFTKINEGDLITFYNYEEK